MERGTSPTAVSDVASRGSLTRRRGAVGGPRRVEPVPLVCGALLVVGLALWWWAVQSTNLSAMAGLGLINAFPAAFYVAVALVVGSMVLALVARRLSRTAVLASFGALILVIYGTPAVLFSEPEYAWVYKHLGVIRYIEAHGSTNRAIDIYQNWPGFFAANAWLARATGMDPGAYAAWAPVFFELCLLAGVLYALGGFIADPRRRYAAAFVWQLGSWIGQDYLSPQAMGIVLVVVALGIVLRIGFAGGWDRDAVTVLGRTADRLRDRAESLALAGVRVPREARDAPASSGSEDDGVEAATYPRRDRVVGVVLFAVLAVAVIISHQLSPVMLILSLVVLVGFTGWRRLWLLIAAVVVAEGVWVALAWSTVQRFGLLNIDGPVTPVQAGTGSPMSGVSLVQNDARVIGVAFWVLAAIGIVRMLRRSGTDPTRPAAVVALGFTPYLIVPVQSYGGEAGLRAYLFSLPWLAVLALEAIWPSGTRRVAEPDEQPAAVRTTSVDWAAALLALEAIWPSGTRRVAEPDEQPAAVRTTSVGWAAALTAPRRPWLLAILGPILACLLLVAYYGQALVDWMSTSDVTAAAWVDTNAPAGSIIYALSPGLPDKSTARYPLLRSAAVALTDTETILRPLLIPSQRVNGVRAALNTIPAARAPYLKNIPPQVDYLVITPSQRNYARLEGLMSPSQIDGLVSALRAASDFSVVYDHAGSIIFRYVPGT